MATPTRTTAKSSARERARARRLELDSDRARRDEQIETAAAEFYDAIDANDVLREQIHQNERAMGQVVETLLELKEKPHRIQALLGIDAAELRRLKPTRPRPSTPAVSTPSAFGAEGDAVK